MTALWSLIAFLGAIGLLVSFHEFGHYSAARLCGVRVLRFSVGFGKTLWTYQKNPDATEWALSSLPLGGYVKMDEESFKSKPLWKRSFIVAAGPLANFFLAIVFLATLFVSGVPQIPSKLAEANVDELKARLTPDMKVSTLQSEVNKLNQEIQGLGPVNMAALEELASAQERKTFLDAQSADLNEAINTLTDAIAKIDSETRDLLQGTFDQVNEHFAKLFPDLFGGGNAKLVMTGEEILDSGVQVMAQPPGKKNSTIHLLSGGEKALTAIALVFSLFQLNPAPFCLLDEVDAPLDDANTGRYADMVARMSANTQFVFISHNKITMEIANQLIGVTMQEQGVSRIVAVDLEAAATMVEAA